MRFLGLDVGEKTIGISISDQSGLVAQGIDTLRRDNIFEDIEAIKEFVQKYQVERIIIGLPLKMNGSEGTEALKMREFMAIIKKNIPLPIIAWDERLSTVASEKVLLAADLSRKKRRKVVNQIAAALILQSYLDYWNQQKTRRIQEQEKNC